MEHEAVLMKLGKKAGVLVKVQDALYARASRIGEEALLVKFRIAWTLS